ncbi:MAG: HAD family hydrolase [Candidatus Omnitrophica bacterium]|nr:HAD family hydrolase [Candidatus Omnitrophota bacterium]
MRAIFLDRDGVINRYPGDGKYVTSWKEFHFLPGAKEAIAKLYKNKFKIFVISNQAGVNKGIFSRRTLDLITRNMHLEIKEAQGKIHGVYYCIHRPEENCSCRKPCTGLIDKVKKRYNICIKDSFFIGDTMRDVRTARAAGLKSILVLSGREKLSNCKNWEVKPDFIFRNLREAAEFILSQKIHPSN